MKRAIVIALLLSHSASYAVRIYGTYDCGQWFVKRELAKSWLLGYLSGVNVMLADEKIKYDPLGKLNSAEQAFLWVDNYCKGNPLETLESAGMKLYLELQVK